MDRKGEVGVENALDSGCRKTEGSMSATETRVGVGFEEKASIPLVGMPNE